MEVTEQQYTDLLYKAGQSISHVKLFIATISESGLFPVNMSAKRKASIQQYLTKQLLTEQAMEVLDKYNQRVEWVQSQLKSKQ